ncbi:MAG: SH3 domain-containing protein [Bryobacteraceae bacterium]
MRPFSFEMSRLRGTLVLLSLCALAGCSSGPSRQPEIGAAYAGPVTLKVRREIDPRSPEVVTVAHGERLGIISHRRRFVKVRTAQGIEGWTEARQLLAPEQMEALNRLAETARRTPSQGAATVYEPLNVHTEPNRQAPSFYQIQEGELVELVAHELSPRMLYQAKGLRPPPAPPRKPARKPREETGRLARPPMPPAPSLPGNWIELSKTPVSAPRVPERELQPPKPVPIDDWSLVRFKNGRAGWVLTANLKMNIPDEVAQYSEGHRITSYFALADVNDGGQIKHNWLWTTIRGGSQPYDFDSFRYFIWNVRRHRYETAYVESNLTGYYPVQAHPARLLVNKRLETVPGFILIVEEGGVHYKKTYACQTYIVRLIGRERIAAPPPLSHQASGARAATASPPAPPQPAPTGFGARLKALRERWFGK